MHIGLVRFEAHIPESRSLKEKRAVVKPIVERIRQRHSLSVAEVAHHDKWQRCAVGLAVVAESQRHALDVVNAVERYVWSLPGIEISAFETRWSSWEDAEDDL
ncbi:MAG TPA: DUF503 domain-containing protein [Acidimicrobiales bacterium]|nr:DUF503 domain-containing protein [Acidimicrobiales bacterium]